ncbi:sortase A [Melghiribacillus thermohalophilus]|uniref:Sortase A n=1 Tax=Melghiribacillus thermohalophilus TaxID=1324956 RepID=A0A4R3NCT1_9BACI|nr:sortase A [Melghiribacillus thermohalophilus]
MINGAFDMLKKIGILFIIMGLTFLIYAGYSMFDYYSGSQKQLKQAERYITQFRNEDHMNASAEEKADMFRTDSNPEVGEIFATIEIPDIGLKLPIVEGTGEEQLKYGVGHEPDTWLPGEGNQIFLAGHNDTAFLKVGDIQEGDRIILHLPYGSFEYEMEYSDIGHETEIDRIGPMDQETLVLMTCYPFYSFSDTEERYFIYANPVD